MVNYTPTIRKLVWVETESFRGYQHINRCLKCFIWILKACSLIMVICYRAYIPMNACKCGLKIPFVPIKFVCTFERLSHGMGVSCIEMSKHGLYKGVYRTLYHGPVVVVLCVEHGGGERLGRQRGDGSAPLR